MKRCLIAVIFASASISGLSGCKWFQKKKSSHGGGNDPSYVDQGSLKFIRTAGASNGSLSFKAKVPIDCQIYVDIQATMPSERRKSAVQQSCHITNPDIAFTWDFRGLGSTALYSAEIVAWPLNGQRDQQSISTFADEELSKGMGGTMARLRIAGPVYTAELQMNTAQPSQTIRSYYSKIRPYEGCRPETSESIPANDFTYNPISFQSVVLSGYVVSEGIKINDPAPAVRFGLNDVRNEENLIVNIQESTNSPITKIGLGTIPRITSLNLSQGDKSLSPTQGPLAPPAQSIAIAAGQDLLMTWTVSESNADSFVDVALFPPHGSDRLRCYFPASAGRVTIPTALLNQYHSLELAFGFQHYRWVSPAGENKRTWVVNRSDWRNARLEKL